MELISSIIIIFLELYYEKQINILFLMKEVQSIS
jgi:hypothetical protein